jgi:hypothetical protein
VFAAAFAFVLLGVGLAAIGCFGAASEAKSGILKAGELALDGIGDPFRSSPRAETMYVLSNSCDGTCTVLTY